MKNNKARHNAGILQDAGLRLLVDQDIRGKSKIIGTAGKTAHDQTCDSQEDSRSQKIRNQVEPIPRTAARTERYKSFQEIDQIHSAIVEKSIKDQRVEKRNQRTFFENGLLG